MFQLGATAAISRAPTNRMLCSRASRYLSLVRPHTTAAAALKMPGTFSCVDGSDCPVSWSFHLHTKHSTPHALPDDVASRCLSDDDTTMPSLSR